MNTPYCLCLCLIHRRSLRLPVQAVTRVRLTLPHMHAANIAFVLFDKWAAAEQAMEGLNGATQTPGAANPLVVKFADGKPKAAANGAPGVGMKRGNEAEASALSKRMNLGGVCPPLSSVLHYHARAVSACVHQSIAAAACRHACPPGCPLGFPCFMHTRSAQHRCKASSCQWTASDAPTRMALHVMGRCVPRLALLRLVLLAAGCMTRGRCL